MFKKFLFSLKSIVNQIFAPYLFELVDDHEYDVYWSLRTSTSSPKVNSFKLFRTQWISERITNQSRVLDIGCGDGLLFPIYIISIRFVRLVVTFFFFMDKLKSNNISFQQLEVKDLDTIIFQKNSFDYILMLELLNILRTLNHFSFKHFLRFLAHFLSVFQIQVLYHIDCVFYLVVSYPVESFPSEHLRFWTMSDFRQWLLCLGFKRSQFNICGYEGVPLLNSLFPSLFAMGLIIKIDK